MSIQTKKYSVPIRWKLKPKKNIVIKQVNKKFHEKSKYINDMLTTEEEKSETSYHKKSGYDTDSKTSLHTKNSYKLDIFGE